MIKIEVTETQKANLKKLADYLAALPEDYEHFNMGDYHTASSVPCKVPLGPCGACACAVGHGPLAGIPIENEYDWGIYEEKNFTGDNARLYVWLFSPGWSDEDIDNTPQGAAKRIYYFLENGGIPDNFREFPTFYQE